MFNVLHVVNYNKWNVFFIVFLYQYDTRLSYLNQSDK